MPTESAAHRHLSIKPANSQAGEMSNAKQEPGITDMTILSSHAKNLGVRKTTEHERQQQNKLKRWSAEAQALQQESTLLLAELAATYLRRRQSIVVIMAIMPMAALLWITAPYYVMYNPAAYTVDAIFVAAFIAALAAICWPTRWESKNPSLVTYRFITSSERIGLASAQMVGEFCQIVMDNNGHPNQLSLSVRQLQQRVGVWEAQKQALHAQDKRNDLVQQIIQSYFGTIGLEFAALMGLAVPAVFILMIQLEYKHLDLSSTLLFQLMPAVVLLGYFIAFKAVKSECKELSDSSKRLLDKVAKTVVARDCAEELV